ncbi:MAG: protease complex subunit PrcB family protein [Spirochaetaceae bacterium]
MRWRAVLGAAVVTAAVLSALLLLTLAEAEAQGSGPEEAREDVNSPSGERIAPNEVDEDRLVAAGSEQAPEDERDDAGATEAIVETATPCPCDLDEPGVEPNSRRIVARGAHAAQQEHLLARADTELTFKKLWRRVARTRVPEPGPPAIDFDRETVVAVFAGQRSTGGYSVEIDAVCRTPEAGSESSAAASEAVLHLCYTEYEPAEDAMVTMALTSPYVVVAVEGRPERVVVHRRSRTR